MTYQEFVISRVKWLPTVGENLAHAGMGLLGEVYELEIYDGIKNYLEELGDVEFYLGHYKQSLGAYYTGEDFVPREEARAIEANPLNALKLHAATLHDFAKKIWIYQKPILGLPLTAHIIRTELCLHFLAENVKKTRQEVQQINQEKLTKRYPNGYSDKDAQERKDKQ